MNLPPEVLNQLLEVRRRATGVSTDTRSDLKGQIFVALRGANFDGNEFVGNALESGAIHAITSDESWTEQPQVTVVQNELEALQEFAKAYRQSWTCPVLGMTGSNGKTTTKELIRDVLGTSYRVHATPGNLNNHIGVPLTLLNAPQNPDFVVVEMGANHQGEIAELSNIALPTCGYITNIGLAHLEGFGGAEGVYKGKKELFDYLKSVGGTAFVQTGDEKVIKASRGIADTVDILSEGWQWEGLSQGGATVTTPEGLRFDMQLEGSYNLPNVAAAICIGKHFGVDPSVASKALSSYVPSNLRSQAVQTTSNWVLLDAYNANPSSMAHAVDDFLKRQHSSPMIILGDMAELGDESLQAHETLAEKVTKSRVKFWTVGPWFGKVHSNSRTPKWEHFSSIEDVKARLAIDPIVKHQILVKGSRSAGLERLLPNL